jgi:ribonuclease HI
VFSDTLDMGESYALGSLATVFQTEVYAILTCSDYCRSVNMHNMTICIYVLIARLRCWLYPHIQFRLNFNTRALLSLQDLSNNNRVRLFWFPGHCDIKGNEEADRLARMKFKFMKSKISEY